MNIPWKDWRTSCWRWNSNTLAIWCKELTHLKRSWCWSRLKVGGKGYNKGWDGWMASLTQWTWVWVNSGSWWWTRNSGLLQSMGSQTDMTEWLNWMEGQVCCIFLWNKLFLTYSSHKPWSKDVFQKKSDILPSKGSGFCLRKWTVREEVSTWEVVICPHFSC